MFFMVEYPLILIIYICLNIRFHPQWTPLILSLIMTISALAAWSSPHRKTWMTGELTFVNATKEPAVR